MAFRNVIEAIGSEASSIIRAAAEKHVARPRKGQHRFRGCLIRRRFHELMAFCLMR